MIKDFTYVDDVIEGINLLLLKLQLKMNFLKVLLQHLQKVGLHLEYLI